MRGKKAAPNWKARAEHAEDALEAAADTIESLLYSMKLPLPAELHLQGLRGSLTQLHERLRTELEEVTT